jgi:hypothetical protein
MNVAVDEFVKARVLPRHRDIVARLRMLIRECAPNAKEEMSYGIPAWRGRRILVVISPTKKDVTFAFSRGAEFVDVHGLLKGAGRVSKHVKMNTLADVNEAALRDYIRQALELDATGTSTTGSA